MAEEIALVAKNKGGAASTAFVFPFFTDRLADHLIQQPQTPSQFTGPAFHRVMAHRRQSRGRWMACCSPELHLLIGFGWGDIQIVTEDSTLRFPQFEKILG
jgi:hypothetical protein